MTARSICTEVDHALESKLRCTAPHTQILGGQPGAAHVRAFTGSQQLAAFAHETQQGLELAVGNLITRQPLAFAQVALPRSDSCMHLMAPSAICAGMRLKMQQAAPQAFYTSSGSVRHSIALR